MAETEIILVAHEPDPADLPAIRERQRRALDRLMRAAVRIARVEAPHLVTPYLIAAAESASEFDDEMGDDFDDESEPELDDETGDELDATDDIEGDPR